VFTSSEVIICSLTPIPDGIKKITNPISQDEENIKE
jgi:hypothetical protein